MEITFYEHPSEKELLYLDTNVLEDDGSLKYEWPFLPRKGETIILVYDKGKEIDGMVVAVHWTSVAGILTAVQIYITTR